MFTKAATTEELKKQTAYLKYKIKEAFSIVSKTNIVDEKEISYLMRYLNQFPSEAQVREYILPKLEDDEPNEYIKYEKIEPVLLDILLHNEFEPSPVEHLLAAFRVLDPEGKGYIPESVMRNLLMNQGIKFDDRVYTPFHDFAIDKTGQFFYYEDYVAKLMEENEKHMQFLLKDYENFKPPYT